MHSNIKVLLVVFSWLSVKHVSPKKHSSIKGTVTNQNMDAKSLQNILELFLISSKNSTNTEEYNMQSLKRLKEKLPPEDKQSSPTSSTFPLLAARLISQSEQHN